VPLSGGGIPANIAETFLTPRLSSAEDKQHVPVSSMTEPGLDVAACVERVRQRDEDAARLLLAHLYPLVLKLVRAHLPQRTSEEDLVQIVFMKVFAKLDQYGGNVPLEHWVSRIAVNTCINQLKAEKVRPELRWADLSEEQQFVVQSLAASDSELESNDASTAREIVEKLLAHLNPTDRLLLTLLHLEGHSGQEVARMLGWNHLRVRVQSFRARQKLRRQFRNLMYDLES
jgi:RNA polymerase sigma-70 factor, ECF subfamily